jgi:hypothetical protein
MIKNLSVNRRNMSHTSFMHAYFGKIVGSRMATGLKHTPSLAFYKADITAATRP